MTLRYGWSLEEKDWSEIPGEIKNGDWKKIKYHPQNEQFIPQSSGLYIIEGITNNTFPIQFSTPMYIGYTLALRRRYIEHLSTKGKKIMDEFNLEQDMHDTIDLLMDCMETNKVEKKVGILCMLNIVSHHVAEMNNPEMWKQRFMMLFDKGTSSFIKDRKENGINKPKISNSGDS